MIRRVRLSICKADGKLQRNTGKRVSTQKNMGTSKIRLYVLHLQNPTVKKIALLFFVGKRKRTIPKLISYFNLLIENVLSVVQNKHIGD